MILSVWAGDALQPSRGILVSRGNPGVSVSHSPARGSAVLNPPPCTSSIFTTQVHTAILSCLDYLTVSCPPLTVFTVSFLSRSRKNLKKKGKIKHNQIMCRHHQNPLMTSSFTNIPPSLLTTDPPSFRVIWSLASVPGFFQTSRTFLTVLGLRGLSGVQTHASHPAPGIGCPFWLGRISLLSSSGGLCLPAEASLPQSPIPWPRQLQSPTCGHRNGSPAASALLCDLETQLLSLFLCKMRIMMAPST